MKPSAQTIGVFATILVLLIVYANVSVGQSVPVVSDVQKSYLEVGEGPVLSAKSYVVFDVSSGDILVAQEPDKILPIASITKLITAAVVMKTIPLEDEVTLVASDEAGHGRSGRLKAGDVYKVHELLFPLLLESSNDAAAAYERLTKNEIVTDMNKFTVSLGATRTYLVDASGISGKNVSTAREVALLSRAIYETEPHVFDISQLKTRLGPHVGWTNNSPVLFPAYKGGKHGYTEEAKGTIVSYFNETLHSTDKLVGYVVLGSNDIKSDIETLRNFVSTEVSFE